MIFLGADDRFATPEVLSRIAPVLADAIGRHRIVYAGLKVEAADGRIVESAGGPWPQSRRDLRRGMSIPHSATFHHRTVFDTGAFNETFRIAGDYELILRELPDRDALFVPDLTLVVKGASGVSARPETRVEMILENHRAKRMHGLTRTPEWLDPIVIRTRTRAWIRRTFGHRVEASITSVYRATIHPRRR